MGHASFYQNFALYKKFDEKDDEGYMSMLEEGVSEKFMKKGLKILKDKKHIGVLGYYRKISGHAVSRTAKGLIPDVYYIGESVIDSYLKRGVKIRDIILRADEFKEDLEKNGWENICKK